MSMGIWEHGGESSHTAEKAVAKEFPMCKDLLHDSFECVRALQSQNIHTAEIEDKLCREKKARATWCILASFCPAEAAAFMQCNKNRIPGVKENNVSFFCTDAWQKFDSCLVKLTNENEAATKTSNT